MALLLARVYTKRIYQASQKRPERPVYTMGRSNPERGLMLNQRNLRRIHGWGKLNLTRRRGGRREAGSRPAA
jgi:hypothetical protein